MLGIYTIVRFQLKTLKIIMNENLGENFIKKTDYSLHFCLKIFYNHFTLFATIMLKSD